MGDSWTGKEEGKISQGRQSRAHSPFHTLPRGSVWIAVSGTSLGTQLCQDRLVLACGGLKALPVVWKGWG